MPKVGCPRHKTGEYRVPTPESEREQPIDGDGDVRVDSGALESKPKGFHQDATVVPDAQACQSMQSDTEGNSIDVHDDGDEVVVSWKRTDDAPEVKAAHVKAPEKVAKKAGKQKKA